MSKTSIKPIFGSPQAFAGSPKFQPSLIIGSRILKANTSLRTVPVSTTKTGGSPRDMPHYLVTTAAASISKKTVGGGHGPTRSIKSPPRGIQLKP